MKTPDYLSYDRYKKNKSRGNSKSSMAIFITTFFVTLLFFTIVAKSLSPNVDVRIGNESETDAKETGLGVKKLIDERLKIIQLDDNSNGNVVNANDKKAAGIQDENVDKFSQELEEKVSLPDRSSKSVNPEVNDSSVASIQVPPRPGTKDLATPFAGGPKMSKVLVGRYTTFEQAKVAQEILMDSGLSITPFVKNTGGSYTLQVGSYSSRTKAEELASELQKNNFPARIVQE